VKRVGDVDLELAEPAPEGDQVLRLQKLPGKAQHPVFAQGPQDAPEVVLGKGLSQIHSVGFGRPMRRRRV
jgi:hypothetical protein